MTERNLEQARPDQDPNNRKALAPYDQAYEVTMEIVRRYQAAGELPWLTEITDEDEEDEYYREVSRIYRQVCQALGLSWPPEALAPLD